MKSALILLVLIGAAILAVTAKDSYDRHVLAAKEEADRQSAIAAHEAFWKDAGQAPAPQPYNPYTHTK